MKRIGTLFATMGSMLVFAALTDAADSTNSTLTPMQAVFSAAEAAPAGVAGTFRLRIQLAGRQDGNIYLDSEKDYRDPRNLCIAFFPEGARSFHAKFGADPDDLLVGKWVLVRGVARRVKIVLTYDGQATDKYYYQTHVDVTSADQIRIESH